MRVFRPMTRKMICSDRPSDWKVTAKGTLILARYSLPGFTDAGLTRTETRQDVEEESIGMIKCRHANLPVDP